MINLPHRLVGKWKLVAADVAALFTPVVAEINGRLGPEHFSRRAGIRNEQKAARWSYVATQGRVAAVPLLSLPATVKLVAVCPSRYLTAMGTNPLPGAWEFLGAQFAYSDDGPFDGTLHIGGTWDDPDHSVALSNAVPLTALYDSPDDVTDPLTGNVYASVDVEIGTAGIADLVLTAFWRAKHVR